MRAVEREAYYLGLGMGNLMNRFVPDVIVLGGSVMKSAALFLDGIRKVIRQGCRFVPYEKTELALASLGEDANLIGAARAWHHRFRQGVGAPSWSIANAANRLKQSPLDVSAETVCG